MYRLLSKEFTKIKKNERLARYLFLLGFLSFLGILIATFSPGLPKIGVYIVAGLGAFFSVMGFLVTTFWGITEKDLEIHNDPILHLSGHGLNLYELVESIFQATDETSKKLNHLRDQSSILDGKIQETNQDMERIFQVVTNLANQEVVLIEDVGKTSTEITFMFDIVNAVIDEIDSRNENMKNLVRLSETGGTKVNRTNDIIKSISEKSGDMLKMVDFINNITKETNLLAINASIEATHSDTEGKGFNVIADEMKKLAVLISQKAKEISKLMKANIEEYEEASKASGESGEAFHQISSEIHVVSGTIAEVVQTISEVKNRGTTVMGKAKALDDSAEAVKDSSGEVYGEIVNVNNTLNELTELSDEVKTSISEIAKSQEAILEQGKRVHNLVRNINRYTDMFLGIEESMEDESLSVTSIGSAKEPAPKNED